MATPQILVLTPTQELTDTVIVTLGRLGYGATDHLRPDRPDLALVGGHALAHRLRGWYEGPVAYLPEVPSRRSLLTTVELALCRPPVAQRGDRPRSDHENR